jgi:hypothetical protein
MNKKSMLVSILILGALILSACSGLQLAGSSTSQTSVPTTESQSSTSTLSLAILELESTDLAITSAQAKNLLFLWKGVKALGSDKSAATVEKSALYEQIQEAMTAEQIQAIAEMEFTSDEVSSLMLKYSVTTTSSTQAKSQSLTSTTFSGGDVGMGGGGGEMMILSGGGMPGGSTSSSTTSSSTQTTVKKTTSTSTVIDLNVLFADVVIQVLQQRVDA